MSIAKIREGRKNTLHTTYKVVTQNIKSGDGLVKLISNKVNVFIG